MRLPLFVASQGKIGKSSPRVMVPPGRWSLESSDVEQTFDIVTTARQSDNLFEFDQIGTFQLTCQKDSPSTLWVYLCAESNPT
jgi:hypothetical protein